MTVIKKLLLGMGWLLTVSSLNAQIATDGTLGAPGNLPGPDFQIDSKLGQQRGGNLFHSFSLFNVNTGETATFAGPESVTNILARVTGDQSSFIDGTLRSTIPNANLYLLNPSGILFGENAQLDISGSFHVSTANYVNLGEEGRFYTNVGTQSILTVAPPSAFGFLNNQAAPISIQGSSLETTKGKTLSLSGGDISFEGGAGLFAPGGEINLTSETSGNISMEGESWLFAPGGKIHLTSKLGSINISSHSYVSVSGIDEHYGEIGGEIFIRAGKLFIQDSELYAQGVKRGGDLTINAPIFTMDNSWLVANGWSGEGGNIFISSGQFMLSVNNTIIASSKLSMGGRLLDISIKDAERSVASDIKLPTGYSKTDSLLFNHCGGEDQSRFVITASDIPQETPYDLQTHWVLPRRRK